MLTLTQTRNTLESTLKVWTVEMRKDAATAVREAARRVTRQVIALTPPASAGFTGRDAYQQGRSKIARQMSAVFAPRTLKGRRAISVVFGRRLARPVTVPTTERHPDVASLYRAQLKANPAGTRLTLRGYRGKVLYVDRRKFAAELTRRQGRVGVLASGWLPGARALDVPVLRWIARHGGANGGVSIATGPGRFGIRVRNFGTGLPSALRGELNRRIPYALRYVERGLRANIHHAGLNSARRSGIRVRSGA